MTKTCKVCNMEKDLSNFYLHANGSNRSWCKKCLLKYQTDRWKARKQQAVILMGGKCVDCGYDRNIGALQFHHLDPKQKEFNWNKVCKKNWNIVVAELKKCVCLCGNCHVERHNPQLMKDTLACLESNVANHMLHDKDRKLVASGKCKICNSDVFGTMFCSNICRGISRRKAHRPTMEKLIQLLNTKKSICEIAREYQVSDNAVRKWAKVYGLSTKINNDKNPDIVSG